MMVVIFSGIASMPQCDTKNQLFGWHPKHTVLLVQFHAEGSQIVEGHVSEPLHYTQFGLLDNCILHWYVAPAFVRPNEMVV